MGKGPTPTLHLRLTGPFACRIDEGEEVDVGGPKHRALLAMLALAPDGKHSRNWLRETLWSRVEREQGADSLRQCLSALRRRLGHDFTTFPATDRFEIGLRMDRVSVSCDLSDGEFLEGVAVAEPTFTAWRERALSVVKARQADGQSAAYGSLRPTIGVVPFLARGNRDAERHLSDLVAQEATRILSRNRTFDVISHLSSRRFTGPSLDLDAIATALGTDYVATGCIASAGDDFRIDVDFLETASGRVVWTEAFTGRVADLIAPDSAVMAGIAHRIGMGVFRTSVELTRSNPLPHVHSHALFMSALSHMHQHRLRTFSLARHMLENLIERHPDRAPLHAWLGLWYLLRQAQGIGDRSCDDLSLARDATAAALDLDPACPVSLTIDGMAGSHHARDFTLAAGRFEEAIGADPNNALAFLMYSRLLSFTGKGPEAVRYAERARVLSPRDPQEYFFEVMRATAYLVAGDLPKARSIAETAVGANPRHTSSLRCLAIAAELMGDREAARSAITMLRAREPTLTVSSYLAAHPAGELAAGQQWARALRSAGLPD